MNLYPEEMAEIAKVIETLNNYVDALCSFKHIEVELPDSISILVRNKNTDTTTTIGTVDYTDDGAIGFITWED